MKTTILILTCVVATWSQPNFNAVISAIKDGNVTVLSQHMDTDVEITIEEEDGTYNKTEATNVVKGFFDNNKPSACSIVHSGAARNNGAYFCIGSLTAGGKSHRVYLFFKENEGKFLIQEMRFELN
ncbi:MAG: DUF4783 domain-containing protein [Aureispira sp.]|nr:DUF4783 domain-containing protein [Aureispira sp.]